MTRSDFFVAPLAGAVAPVPRELHSPRWLRLGTRSKRCRSRGLAVDECVEEGNEDRWCITSDPTSSVDDDDDMLRIASDGEASNSRFNAVHRVRVRNVAQGPAVKREIPLLPPALETEEDQVEDPAWLEHDRFIQSPCCWRQRCSDLNDQLIWDVSLLHQHATATVTEPDKKIRRPRSWDPPPLRRRSRDCHTLE